MMRSKISARSSAPSPIADALSIFEHAVRMLQHQIEWIDHGDPCDVAKNTAACALAILTMVPRSSFKTRLIRFFLRVIKTNLDYVTLWSDYEIIVSKIQLDATEFIKRKSLDKKTLNRKWKLYVRVMITCDIMSFLVIYKPCCRMTKIAWLIPSIAAGVPAIPIVASAAHELAELMNDPTEPFHPDCMHIGNSWLHRLGIYLLHQCSMNEIAPCDELIRLMSLVAPPPSASVKSGKAVRYFDYLSNPIYPHYLHEAPPDQAIGKALALEALGEFDANRQGEYFRRIERAVAFFAVSLLATDNPPSIKRIAEASGLSWSDANKLVGRPFFRRLVFEHQCRHMLAADPADCQDCADLARVLRERKEDASVLPSSGSSW